MQEAKSVDILLTAFAVCVLLDLSETFALQN
jgi:hypothetical protein